MPAGTVIQGIITVLSLLPTLMETINLLTKQAEVESPSGGGNVQKPAVVGLVKAAVDAADKFDPDGELLNQQTKDAIVHVAGEATDLIVGMHNALGTFKHGSKE